MPQILQLEHDVEQQRYHTTLLGATSSWKRHVQRKYTEPVRSHMPASEYKSMSTHRERRASQALPEAYIPRRTAFVKQALNAGCEAE